jgi:polyribonucleotide nucleotidyltransferase
VTRNSPPLKAIPKKLLHIPFYNLISEVRVARIDGKFVINPSREDLAKSDIDMMIGASMDSVAMVEGEMK